MAYEVKIASGANREIERLPDKLRKRVFSEAAALAENPRHHGVIKLEGENLYRARVGDYRMIFEIHDSILLVLVLKVGHRGDVYK